MRQLLSTITETIYTLIPVVNYAVTEFVLFSIVAFKTLAFHEVRGLINK